MFAKAKPASRLETAIRCAVIELDEHKPDSEEYGVIVERISKLHKIKEDEKSSYRVSPDTLAMITANLLGIVLIIRHENVNVISSKALGFVQKPK